MLYAVEKFLLGLTFHVSSLYAVNVYDLCTTKALYEKLQG